MPTEITVTAYEFHELDGEAKDKARERLISAVTGYEWWQDVYEDAVEKGTALGFYIDDIRFSGFSSQGDGASWTGHVDMMVFIEKHADKESASFGEDMILVELMRNEWANPKVHIVRRSYHYVHENTMTYEYEDWSLLVVNTNCLEQGVMEGANVKALFNSMDVDERVEHWLREVERETKAYAKQIYKDLEKDHDFITSDENLSEFAKFNEYLFDEEGRIL
jgi:hypothetical protein